LFWVGRLALQFPLHFLPRAVNGTV
jgi:hypothetical protein